MYHNTVYLNSKAVSPSNRTRGGGVASETGHTFHSSTLLGESVFHGS